MGYIRGADRNAVLLFPECVEDYINDDNPVRFIDAFVESLDLVELKFERARPAETGPPAYDPAVLFRLYVYGYLNRVRSSRMLIKAIAAIDEKIGSYLAGLDAQDREETPAVEEVKPWPASPLTSRNR